MADQNSESVFNEEASTYFRPKTWVSFVIVAFLICSMCSAIFVTGVQLHNHNDGQHGVQHAASCV